MILLWENGGTFVKALFPCSWNGGQRCLFLISRGKWKNNQNIGVLEQWGYGGYFKQHLKVQLPN